MPNNGANTKEVCGLGLVYGRSIFKSDKIFVAMEIESGLKVYYREVFPLEKLFEILEISETREIAFSTSQNVYLRYLTFDSVRCFREKIVQANPKRIDVGPVYDTRPAKMNRANPIAKELVFDIDLTDYPRKCCQDKCVCEKCYEKVKCAVRLLDYILKNEFGFKNYGFVFSGRRGVHCWVFDCKEMPNSVRNDIFKYFQSVIDKNLYVKEYNEIMEEFGGGNLIEEYFVRIDKQVTVTMSHLIKMPFSVHPETMNISIPLDPENITELGDIPSLLQVVANPDIMAPYVKILDKWRNC